MTRMNGYYITQQQETEKQQSKTAFLVVAVYFGTKLKLETKRQNIWQELTSHTKGTDV